MGEPVVSRGAAAPEAPSSSGKGPASNNVRYSVPESSVGYKLLKQAGWEEGKGLGASQQAKTAAGRLPGTSSCPLYLPTASHDLLREGQSRWGRGIRKGSAA